MTKEQITSQYSRILMIIAAISILVLLVTPFVPAFKIDLGLIQGSESGVVYLKDMWESISNGSEYESNTFLEDEIPKVLMGWMVGANFVLIAGNIFFFFSGISKQKDKSCIHRMTEIIQNAFIASAVYFAYCFIVICWQLEWDFDMVLSTDSVMTTDTIWPFLIQLVLFIASFAIYQQWKPAYKQALAEESAQQPACTPSQTKAAQAPQVVQAKTSNASPPQPEASPMSVQEKLDHLELLKKYKELLDANIITEEEFQVKKQELLNADKQASVITDEQAQPESAPTAITSPPKKPYRNIYTLKIQDQPKSSDRHCQRCDFPLNETQKKCPRCGKKNRQK